MIGVRDILQKGNERLASDPTRSSWVEANAGSGKTHLIIERMLRLLLSGVEPQNILGLTYTRNGATEMTDRLHDKLASWLRLDEPELKQELTRLLDKGSVTPDILKRGRHLFTDILDVPGGLKIQTIHSFCESILRRFPVEAGLSPGFAILDKTGAKNLQQRVFDTLISTVRAFDRNAGARMDPDIRPKAKDDSTNGRPHPRAHSTSSISEDLSKADGNAISKALSTLSLLLDSQDLCTLLVKFAGQWQCLKAFDKKPIPPYRALAVKEQTPEEFFHAHMADHTPLSLDIAAVLDTGKKTDKANANSIREYHRNKGLDDNINAFNQYASIFLTKVSEYKKILCTKDIANHNPDVLEAMRAEQERIFNLDTEMKKTRTAWLSTLLAQVGERFSSLYQKAKAREGWLDYNDLIERAYAILSQDGGTSWVMFKMDQSIDHVLVDEAHDTSPQQWQIIKLLCDEFFSGEGAHDDKKRTLCVVGDRKQSIFRFQGADPEEFDNARAWLREKSQASLAHLDFSYRCGPLLLKEIDQIFASEELTKALVGDTGQEIRHRSGCRERDSQIVPWGLEKADETTLDAWEFPQELKEWDEAPIILAGRIADTVHQWIGRPFPPPEKMPSTLSAPSSSPSSLSAPPSSVRAPVVPIGQGARGPTIETSSPLSPGRKSAPSGGRSDGNADDDGQPIQAKDFLILVRTRSRIVQALTRELKKRAIPVISDEKIEFRRDLAIRDCLACAAFALDCQDDFTLAALLKSSFVGMDDNDLTTLRYGDSVAQESRRFPPGHLWQALTEKGDIQSQSRPNGNAPSLSEGTAPSASQSPFSSACSTAWAFCQDLRKHADLPPFEFFDRLLGNSPFPPASLSGKQRIFERLGKECADIIDEFLTAAIDFETGHIPSLEHFCHWIDVDAPVFEHRGRSTTDGVRIMTVHGAKGLEAPIVILADAAKTSANSENTVPSLCSYPAGKALLWDDHGYIRKTDPIGEQDKQEEMRLLYVAMTRARRRLYVTGWKPAANRGKSGSAMGEKTPKKQNKKTSGSKRLIEDNWYNIITRRAFLDGDGGDA